MWYKYSQSTENAFEHVANLLIINKIEKQYFRKYKIFPTKKILDTYVKRVYSYINKNFRNLWDLRKSTGERSIEALIEKALENFNL